MGSVTRDRKRKKESFNELNDAYDVSTKKIPWNDEELRLINVKIEKDDKTRREKDIMAIIKKEPGINEDLDDHDYRQSKRKKITEEKAFVEKDINNLDRNLINHIFYTLSYLKQDGYVKLNIDVKNNGIQLANSEGIFNMNTEKLLNIKETSIQNLEWPKQYNHRESLDKRTSDLEYNVEFDCKNNLTLTSKNLGKDLFRLLNHFHKLPINAPVRNKRIFSKNNYYREALINHLSTINDEKEFTMFEGADNLESVDEIQVRQTPDLSKLVKLDGEEYEIAHEKIIESLVDHINYTINYDYEGLNKETLRRKELRLHIAMLQSYRKLEIYLKSKQTRGMGETVKRQAFQELSYKIGCPTRTITLMILRATRIERLLELTDNDWRLLDAFEELSVKFLTGSINTVVNYERWLNLVKTNTLITFDEGKLYYKYWKTESRTKREEMFDIALTELNDISFDEGDSDDEGDDED